MSESDKDKPLTHYSFSITLRVDHPTMDPENITASTGIAPVNCWRVGEPRRTPKGTPLPGIYPSTYWYADISAGRYPVKLNQTIYESLMRVSPHRAFFHQIRLEGGSVEFFIGWFLDNQTGEALDHQCLALAGDLKIDLSLDVYPPDER